MTIALKPPRQHDYRLSAYKRKANDFYPTPCDLAVSLPFGPPRLGLDLPRVGLIRVAATERSAVPLPRLESM